MRRSKTRVEKLRRKRRWTRVEGQAAVDAWRASGLSVAKFAAGNGLHPVRVRRWARRLAAEAMVTKPVLLPVKVVPSRPMNPAIAAAAVVEVGLDAGRRVLRMPAQLDAETIRRLVSAVETA